MAPADRLGSAAWLVVFLGSLALLAGAVAVGEGREAWRGLLVGFLFVGSAGGGMITWAAVLQAVNARWSGDAERMALGALASGPVALVALVVLWVGVEQWAPWARHPRPEVGSWLAPHFVMARDLGVLVLFWGVAAMWVRRRIRRHRARDATPVLLAYGIAYSLLGFDLVMSLPHAWPSAMVGGWFFLGAMAMAMAAILVALLARRPPRAEVRKDLGSLLLAFGLLGFYTTYAQVLPLWYENLPHEVQVFHPRTGDGPWVWGTVGAAVFYLGPLVLLLPEEARRSRRWLLGVATLVLAAGWVERLWMVGPPLGGPPRPTLWDLSITGLMLSAWGLLHPRVMARLPAALPRPGSDR